MRGVLLSLAVFAACGLSAGCAQREAATLSPTPDELPTFEQATRITPVSVGVEGRGEEPSVILVPTFEEPELTAEERAALGIEEEPFDWLEFYRPLPAEMRILPELGGVRTAIHGAGGPAVGHVLVKPSRAVAGTGGVTTGAHTERPSRAITGPPGASVGRSGPSSGVRVGENSRSKVSSHHTRPEP